MKRQLLQAKNDNALLNELESDGDPSEPADRRLMKELGITGMSHGRPLLTPALHHDKAFQDSPEERKIFEIGLQILAMNPALAKSIKANDAAKHRPTGVKRARLEGKTEAEVEEDPWKKRIEKIEREKRERGRRAPGRQLVGDMDVED